jgi:hypothetical protein
MPIRHGEYADSAFASWRSAVTPLDDEYGKLDKKDTVSGGRSDIPSMYGGIKCIWRLSIKDLA